MYVTTTTYTDTCVGCTGITKIGINLRINPYKKVIAVDTKVIPLHIIVYVKMLWVSYCRGYRWCYKRLFI
ncbi:hypothetical protein RST01_01790 [Rummeliibacillus stabekisii]|nr:hypothetical protein RST01_01790 [Rummeliibacillus stabekisii]